MSSNAKMLIQTLDYIFCQNLYFGEFCLFLANVSNFAESAEHKRTHVGCSGENRWEGTGGGREPNLKSQEMMEAWVEAWSNHTEGTKGAWQQKRRENPGDRGAPAG